MSLFEIETERLVLKDYRASDMDAVHKYASILGVCKYEPWGPNEYKDTVAFIEQCISWSKDEPRWIYEGGVFLKESGLLIGGCRVSKESPLSKVSSLGYVINPKHQGQGYATELSDALINFGFKDLESYIIFATCDARNLASRRVLEKNGMSLVGLIKNHMQLRDGPRDSLRYEILKPSRS